MKKTLIFIFCIASLGSPLRASCDEEIAVYPCKDNKGKRFYLIQNINLGVTLNYANPAINYYWTLFSRELSITYHLYAPPVPNFNAGSLSSATLYISGSHVQSLVVYFHPDTARYFAQNSQIIQQLLPPPPPPQFPRALLPVFWGGGASSH